MNRSSSKAFGVAAGTAAAVAASAALYMANGKSMKSRRRRLKKSATKAVKNMGEIASSISSMMG